ncbi:hypothetical protein SLS62_002735 [Diatrype stigma]|uniref:Uncharacterized protein n=1 Tax=Diatrype stigma TaxID=117547 RepID=A0AAN9UZL4_9PEZI
MAPFKAAPETARTQSAMSSSVRGRISGPIPMDNEFPPRKPGSVVAFEGGDSRHSRQLQSSATGSTNVTGNAPSDAIYEEESTDPPAQSGPSQASNASGSPQNPRTMRASTVRYSMVSNDSVPSRRPQRKKSTLKSTLGRIFGRKKKSTGELSGVDVPIPEPPSPTHHQSVSLVTMYAREHPAVGHRNNASNQDNSALSQSQGFPKESEPKRSASLPITEFSKALRSNSVGPNDMVAIQSARNSVQLDSDRRRATMSSRILSTGPSELNGEMIGLTPRPASAHGRGSRLADTDDPEDIGRAITSDSLALRRRSRSLSQLPQVVCDQTEVRRRSAEIRYWRDSHEPEPETPREENDEASHMDAEEEEDRVEPLSAPPPLVPSQPLTFTPMPNLQSPETASLEDRIATLEARNEKLLKLVSQLFEVVPGVDAYVEPPPTANGAPSFTLTATSSAAAHSLLYRTTSNDVHPQSRQSDESFGDGHTFIGSTHLSTAPASRPRPTSTTTVRGTVREATSLPTMPREGLNSFTSDPYTTLKALIDTEVAARQALEAQVTRLNHRVNRISRSAQGPDTGADLRNGTLSMFEHDDEDDELPTPSYDNYSESETYKTPHEELGEHDFEADHEEFSEKGVSKRAPRTLSLGQLTLNKHQREQQELRDLHTPEPDMDL